MRGPAERLVQDGNGDYLASRGEFMAFSYGFPHRASPRYQPRGLDLNRSQQLSAILDERPRVMTVS